MAKCREILSLLRLPITPYPRYGGDNESRTHTNDFADRFHTAWSISIGEWGRSRTYVVSYVPDLQSGVFANWTYPPKWSPRQESNLHLTD